jgi:two-component system sensor histidine kinase UhpB
MTPSRVERLHELAGHLLVAQDAERERLARELHDHVGQGLAGVSLVLSGLRRRIAGRDPATLEASLTELQRQTMGLADTVGQLAHQLQPGGLQQVGIIEALSFHCAEFQRQYGVEVSFNATGDLATIPEDTARCLFRGAQEALSNIARHAGARGAQVTLSCANGEWLLTVADDGRGFDVAGVDRDGAGLGLLIIEERARLLNGRIQIESNSGKGTTLQLAVPDTNALTTREM